MGEVCHDENLLLENSLIFMVFGDLGWRDWDLLAH
jgi:hypothetical protein